MNNRVQLPIRTFESFGETLENSNFHPVKIRICHTGENLNGSVFSIDSFNKSINTLSNIPILAFVEKDDNGNKDFAGHEIDMDVFVDDDGKIVWLPGLKKSKFDKTKSEKYDIILKYY